MHFIKNLTHFFSSTMKAGLPCYLKSLFEIFYFLPLLGNIPGLHKLKKDIVNSQAINTPPSTALNQKNVLDTATKISILILYMYFWCSGLNNIICRFSLIQFLSSGDTKDSHCDYLNTVPCISY